MVKEGLGRNRNFIIYSAQRGASSLGYTLYVITIPAYSLIASGNLVFTGLTLFVEYGIYMFTFAFGPLVDVVEDKRWIIASARAVIAASAVSMAILMEETVFIPLLFLLLVGIMAVGWSIVWTSNWAVTPLIVEQDDLMKANGYISAISYSHAGAGLFIGAFFLTVVGAYGSVYIYGICMILGAILTLLLPPLKIKDGRKLESGIRGGWLYTLKNNRPLLLLSLLALPAFSFFSSTPVVAITDIFAERSTLYYSIAFSLYSAGAMGIGIIIGRINPNRTGTLIFLTLAISGVFFSLSVLATTLLPVAFVFWFLFGMFFEGWAPLYETYLQSVTEKEMLGRVASNLYTFRGITATAGAFLVPLIVTQSGTPDVFIYFGLLITTISVLMYAVSPSIRSIRQHAGKNQQSIQNEQATQRD